MPGRRDFSRPRRAFDADEELADGERVVSLPGDEDATAHVLMDERELVYAELIAEAA